jgi:DNA-binding CsgD family transcriptional regulator
MGADAGLVGGRLEGVTSRATAGDEFGAVVSSAVRSLIAFDGWCLLGLDPINGLRTFQFGGHGVENTVENARNESLMSDVNQYADLARHQTPIGWLSQDHAAAGTSYRFNEILRPQGVASEIRVVLRDAHRMWGALVLFRDNPRRPFGDEEATQLASITDVLSAAMRLHPVRRGTPADPLAAGTVLLDACNDIVAISREAQAWLDDLVPGGADQTWAKDVTRVVFDAANLLRTRSTPAATCVRTVQGRWLSVHASRLVHGDADVAVTLAPATSRQILRVCVLHRALTGREAEVLSHAVSGLANKQIARKLGISAWTVNEHLTSVYRKFDVSGREELVATLL